MKGFIRRSCLIVAASIYVATGLFGQLAPEGGVFLELNYSNPGARSLALGGAFAALADDATAAFANPAGLVQLVDLEVSMEARYRSFSTSYTRNGRIEGMPTGTGLDTEDGLVYGRTSEDVADLSFLSVVYPRGRWAMAFYRHQLINFEFNAGTQGLFGETGSCCGERFADQTTSTGFDAVGYGLSGAVRILDTLSVGFGVTRFGSSVQASSAIYAPQREDPWGPNRYPPDDRVALVEAEGDASSWGVHGGILWNPRDWLHVAAFYRQAPELDLQARYRGSTGNFDRSATLEFPAVYGAGLGYRSNDGSITVGVEWDRVEYSTISESLGFSSIVIEDGDEVRAGVEYLFIDSSPLWSLRAGVWRDPDHRSRYVGTVPFERALHPPGEEEIHVALGVGVVFKPFQVDLGVDISDPVQTFSLSAIYNF